MKCLLLSFISKQTCFIISLVTHHYRYSFLIVNKIKIQLSLLKLLGLLLIIIFYRKEK